MEGWEIKFQREHIPPSFAFELSNRCNYAQYHPECPTDSKAEPIFLNTDIIKDAIKYFGSMNYIGTLFFNIYNEPLIDPRLFMLLEFNKQHCGCDACLYTNGWGLNQYLVDELIKLNVRITVSYYTDKEEERLSKLQSIMGVRIALDPLVKTIYQNLPIYTGPCRFPSIYGMVNHRGKFVLCCRDYEYRNILGDLNKNSIHEVLTSDYRNEVCERLEAGDRFLDVCKRCLYPGWGIKQEDL